MHVSNMKIKLLQQFSLRNNIEPPVRPDDVIWTNLEIWLQNGNNTRVTIRSKPESNNFSGLQTIYFNRWRIEEVLTGITIPGKRDDYETVHDVIVVLRDKLTLPVDTTEFIDNPITGNTVVLKPTILSMSYLPLSEVELSFDE